MNVVVIVIDTLRYDYIGANGNPDIRTPNLDRLVSQSWNFHRAFAGSYPTIPHRTDALTGRYGAPFHPWKPLDCDKPTIPGVLAESGYCTQLIHDTPHLVNGGHGFDFPFHAWTPVRGAEVDRAWITDSSGLMSNWAFHPLFDCYPHDPEAAMQRVNCLRTYVRTNHGREAEEDWNAAKLFTTAARFLCDNAGRDKFFLWVDCFDPHEPWDAPPEYVKLYDHTPDCDGRIDPRSLDGSWTVSTALPEQCRLRVKAQYAAKVTFVDKWVGVFLDTLAETGLADKTAVVLTADHGTNLPGDRADRLFHKTSPPGLREAHVPFVVHAPGAGSGESDVLVQPQDLFATVLGIADVTPPASIASQDVLTAARGGRSGQRDIALCGTAVNRWQGSGGDGVLFSAFDRDRCLGFAADPAQCRLQDIDSGADLTAVEPETVSRLHQAALDEIGRRGLDPALVSWLRSEGRKPWPEECRVTDAHPAPPGWHTYFRDLYGGE